VFLAITMLVSACTRDQVVCLIVSVAICTFMVLCGYEALIRELTKFRIDFLVEALISLGVWDHFRSLTRGMFRYQDMVWFASIIFTCLLGTSAVLSAKRA
jgi:ABC-2 type transport system permease protein